MVSCQDVIVSEGEQSPLEFNFYKSVVRRAIFVADPETAHGIAKWFFRRTWLWRFFSSHMSLADERLRVTLGSLTLPNPIGLAAGFDKNCEMSGALFRLGFGYLTLGTVTLSPREGNPRPRIWRRSGDSLINSMGLPNIGAQRIVANLSKDKGKHAAPLIVSISGLGVDEFVECYRKIESFADGIELNISSPNTAGVRIFQEPATLSKLLEEIGKVRSSKTPIWVKIPPYFDEKARENVLDLVGVCVNGSVDGITAINTKLVKDQRASIGTGGLSGPPILEDMIRIVREIYTHTGGKIPINACGGISTGRDAWRALESGASSVQLYTAFIYQGPSVASRLNRELLEMLKASKLSALSEVVGTGLS
jgi:dihydroorotate dehydrogenase